MMKHSKFHCGNFWRGVSEWFREGVGPIGIMSHIAPRWWEIEFTGAATRDEHERGRGVHYFANFVSFSEPNECITICDNVTVQSHPHCPSSLHRQLQLAVYFGFCPVPSPNRLFLSLIPLPS